MPQRATRGSGEAAPWFVYLLRCCDGTLYAGVTTDVARRMRQHNAGTAARYTRSRLPVQLVYREMQPTRGDALRREASIKRLSRREKLALIRSGRRGGVTRRGRTRPAGSPAPPRRGAGRDARPS